jgi:hypothetical protein
VAQKSSWSPTNSDINSDGFENTKHISISHAPVDGSDGDSYGDYEEEDRLDQLREEAHLEHERRLGEDFRLLNPFTTRPGSPSASSEPSNFRRPRVGSPRTSSEDSTSQRVLDAEARAFVFSADLTWADPAANNDDWGLFAATTSKKKKGKKVKVRHLGYVSDDCKRANHSIGGTGTTASPAASS